MNSFHCFRMQSNWYFLFISFPPDGHTKVQNVRLAIAVRQSVRSIHTIEMAQFHWKATKYTGERQTVSNQFGSIDTNFTKTMNWRTKKKMIMQIRIYCCTNSAIFRWLQCNCFEINLSMNHQRAHTQIEWLFKWLIDKIIENHVVLFFIRSFHHFLIRRRLWFLWFSTIHES